MELIVKSFQIEENVNSVCLLPLWGFDWLDQIHDLTMTRPDSRVELMRDRINDQVIEQFISILKRMVSLAHVRELTREDLSSVYQAFSDYYDFFQIHSYQIWAHKRVTLAWMNMMTDGLEKGSCSIEFPTVLAMKSTMEFVKRSLFCFTVTLPDQPPDVIQAV